MVSVSNGTVSYYRVGDINNIDELKGCGLSINKNGALVFPEGSHILVDLDGVLADYNKLIVERWHSHPMVVKNGWVPLMDPDAPSFKLSETTEERWGEDAGSLYIDIINSGNFYRTLPVLGKGVDKVKELIKSGYGVQICSKPSKDVPSCEQEKREWISEFLGEQLAVDATITRDKTVTVGDYLIDDANVIAGTHQPSWHHVLYRAPHNNSNISWDTIHTGIC